jgi:hypothetical protein
MLRLGDIGGIQMPAELIRILSGMPAGAPVRSGLPPVRRPLAVILPPSAGRWRAVVPAYLVPGDGIRTTLGAWDLAGLMDQLDEIYPGGVEPARE